MKKPVYWCVNSPSSGISSCVRTVALTSDVPPHLAQLWGGLLILGLYQGLVYVLQPWECKPGSPRPWLDVRKLMLSTPWLWNLLWCVSYFPSTFSLFQFTYWFYLSGRSVIVYGLHCRHARGDLSKHWNASLRQYLEFGLVVPRKQSYFNTCGFS